MLRATFFAAGMFVALWGTAFLFVDQIVLNVPEDYAQQQYQQQQYQQQNQGFRGLFASNTQPQYGPRGRVLSPPDWAAFSLMSIGSVTMLYAAALPKKRMDG